MSDPVRIAIVGLGTIAAAHIEALALVEGVDVVAGVDPDTSRTLAFRGEPRPVLGAAADLAGAGVDAAVVTVPTAAHLAACRELAAAGIPEALVEKPLVASRAELGMLDDARGAMAVWPLLHFALADEVRWAAGRVAEWTAAHGPVTELVQLFSDPYLPHLAERRRSLSGSWLDSGVNALSVVARLAPVGEVVRASPLVDEPGEGAVVVLGVEGGGTATVVTSWHVRRSSKHTHLRLADGARALIDHTAGSGLLFAGGDLVEHFAPRDDGLTSMVSHYVAVHRDWRERRAEAGARLAAGRDLLGRVFDAQELLEPVR